ncbi:MAG: ribonuclease PH [delta proteobacterium ML8_F1]|nr:MAG: ribonuclease PH [delta proteobacterium ML8_F1]
MRINRNKDEIRPVVITDRYLKDPEGSVLIAMGDTKVICTAMVEEKVPGFLKGTGKGWVTAEYAMLPGSTQTRKSRGQFKVDGRSTEIQRLIGRSLRSVVDLEKLGERTLWIDCDVIQADGGTRTAAITGAYVAMVQAMKTLVDRGLLEEVPVRAYVAAVSVGRVDGEICLDLEYSEDVIAQVDMNLVMTDQGEFIEIQGTGEDRPFSSQDLGEMLAYGQKGIDALIAVQKKIIEE